LVPSSSGLPGGFLGFLTDQVCLEKRLQFLQRQACFGNHPAQSCAMFGSENSTIPGV
jgi:hypothetical protein